MVENMPEVGPNEMEWLVNAVLHVLNQSSLNPS